MKLTNGSQTTNTQTLKVRLICFSPVTSQNRNSAQETKECQRVCHILACNYVLASLSDIMGFMGKIRTIFSFLWRPHFIRNYGERLCFVSLS